MTADPAIWAACLSVIAFVTLYGVLARPWRSDLGRAFFTFMLCFAAVMGMIATSKLLGEYPGREALRALVYTGVTVTVWGLGYLLIREQVRVRRRK